MLKIVAGVITGGATLLGVYMVGYQQGDYKNAHALKETSSCNSIEGEWKRSDNLIFKLAQSGCTVSGKVTTDVGSNSHIFDATMSGKIGVGFIRRSVNNCMTILSSEIEVLSNEKLQIELQGHGCELKNHKEVYVYSKVN